MIAVLLSVLVCSPSVARRPAPESSTTSSAASTASEEETRDRLETYLGAIDRPISAANWRALGPSGAAMLQAIADDPQALPSRRAKAVAGLSAIAPVGAASLMLRLAGSETTPRVVRLAAVRGAATVLPEPQIAGSLQPILAKAQDKQVRRAAALALSEHGGCSLVRAQAARETDALSMQRALASCER
jgi:hypothetical protein